MGDKSDANLAHPVPLKDTATRAIITIVQYGQCKILGLLDQVTGKAGFGPELQQSWWGNSV